MESSTPVLSPAESDSSHSPMAALAHYPLASLFAIAFGVTWLGVFAQVAAVHGHAIVPPTIAAGLAVLGCPLAALGVARATGGVTARNALLLRYLRWKVGFRWYAVALLVPVVLLATAGILAHLLGGPALHTSAPASTLLLNLIVGTLLYVRGNWEEMCWRGAALPRLQAKYEPLTASLIIGLVWGLWHLPYEFIPGHAVQVMGLPAYLAFTLGGSVILTWLFNQTDGSLLLVTLFHAVFGSTMQLLIAPEDPLPLYIMTMLVCASAVVVVILSGRRLGLAEARANS